MLPQEMLNLPVAGAHSPMFSFARIRRFAFTFDDVMCFVEQLFGYDSEVAFSVSAHPGGFSTEVRIPCESCELPICCLQFGFFVFVFISGHFGQVIDMSKNPPRLFAVPASLVCPPEFGPSVVPVFDDVIVDLESGKIWRMFLSFDFQRVFSAGHGRLVALLVAKVLTPDLFVQFFSVLTGGTTVFSAWSVLTEFFAFLTASLEFPIDEVSRRGKLSPRHQAVLSDFESRFPSSGMSRSDCFWAKVNRAARQLTFEASCQRVIEEMRMENMTVAHIGTGIERWIETCAPSDESKFMLFTMLRIHTRLCHLPDVPGLLDKLQRIPQEFQSPQLERTLLSLTPAPQTVPEEIETFSSTFSLHSFLDIVDVET
jgi:hypothetical protein